MNVHICRHLKHYVITAICIGCVSCSNPVEPQEFNSTTGALGTAQQAPIYCDHKSVGLVTVGIPGFGSKSCTGTYIGNRWVLTAGHCLTAGDCRNNGGQNNPACKKANAIGFILHNISYVNDTGTFYHLHPNYLYDADDQSDEPTADVAVFRISKDPATEDPTNVWPMQVVTSRPATGTPLVFVGYGPTSETTTDFARRSGNVKVTSSQPDSTELHSEYLDPSKPFSMIHGDSGGPSFVTVGGYEQIAGIHSVAGAVFEDVNAAHYRSWIDGKCGSCLSSWTSPPTGYDPEDVATPECGADGDSDGVIDRRDNCPQTANADQANCNAADDSYFFTDGKAHGDACDPTPCTYITGVFEKVSTSGGGTIKQTGPAEVSYRGVGYEPGPTPPAQDYTNKVLHARYCSCNDPASPDPYNPNLLNLEDCLRDYCKKNGTVNFDDTKDQGWQYVAWTATTDEFSGPSLPESSCDLKDDEGDGYKNECQDPVPSRLYRKLYTGSSMGGKGGHFEKYWTEPKKYRWRYFQWDWQKQDFPHPNGTTWTPPGPSALPTFIASAMVWFHPSDISSIPLVRNNHYTDLRFLGYYLAPILPEALITPLRYMVPEMALIPGSPVFDPTELRVMVHSLAAGRPTEEIQDFLWTSIPEGSATIGLVVKLYNPTNGDLGEPRKNRMASGAVLNTTEFAAAQWPVDELYVFGGRDLNEEMPSRLWHGWMDWEGEEPVYKWEVVAEGGPAGRTGAVLAADPDREQIALLMGQTAGGAVADAWSYSRDTHTWTQKTLQVPGLQPAADVAHAVVDGKLYMYGGRDDETFREGLYVVDLSTFTGQRVDISSSPGARSGAALRYDPVTRNIFLYGGRDGTGTRGDLWLFDLDTLAWTQLSSPTDPGAPPPMEKASIAVCRSTGAISVLSGQVDGGSPTEPAWRLRHGGWQSYSEIAGSGQ